MTTTKVCGKAHPAFRYETGHKVRCGKPRGHAAEGDYAHFDSFAMRSWEDGDTEFDAYGRPVRED